MFGKSMTSIARTTTIMSIFAILLVGVLSPQMAFAQPSVQIAIVIDGSGSVSPSNFGVMIAGVVDAITNVIPTNGSVELTVIQFGTGIVVECGPTVISSVGVQTTFITCVNNIGKLGGGTPMAAAINQAVTSLTNSPNFGVTSLINLITDGAPNSPSATTTAASNAQGAGITGLSAFGIGTSTGTLNFLAGIVFPGTSPGPILVLPAVIPNPTQQGFVVNVATFADFGPAFAEKLAAELPMLRIGGEILPIDNVALMLAGLQSMTVWMLPVLAGAAGATALYFKTRKN